MTQETVEHVLEFRASVWRESCRQRFIVASPKVGWWIRQLYGTYSMRVGPQGVDLDYWAAKPHSTESQLTSQL